MHTANHRKHDVNKHLHLSRCLNTTSFIVMFKHERSNIVTCGLVVLIVGAIAQWKLHNKTNYIKLSSSIANRIYVISIVIIDAILNHCLLTYISASACLTFSANTAKQVCKALHKPGTN